jgi:hypothetical protein
MVRTPARAALAAEAARTVRLCKTGELRFGGKLKRPIRPIAGAVI